MKKIICIVCIFCLFLVSCTNDPKKDSEAWTPSTGSSIAQQLHAFLDKQISEQQLPGASICMIDQDKTMLLKGYGKTRAEGDPITKNTLFQIGTASRLFTSALAGLMVEYRQFEWDSSVSEYLEDFSLQNSWVTQSFSFDDIVLERSGWSPQAGQFLPILGFDENYIMQHTKDFTVHSSFRDSYSPQNIMRLLLTKTISDTTGKNWQELLQTEITSKNNMELVIGASEYYQKEVFAYPHYVDSDDTVHLFPVGSHAMMEVPETMKAALGISMDIDDAVQWLQLFLQQWAQPSNSDNLYGQNVFAELMQPIYRRGTGLFSEHSFCTRSGWVYERVQTEDVYWCVGTGYGFSSLFLMIPSHHAGLVLLTNASNHNLHHEVASIFGKGYFDPAGTYTPSIEELESPGQVPLKLIVDPLKPEAYQGVYTHPIYGDIEVVNNLDNLGILLGQTKEFRELTHYSADVYYFEDLKILPYRVYVSFQQEDSDTIVSCTIDYMKDTDDPFFMKVND
jgi:CubicO group peptidase (beta-lactamase class C family)